MSRCPSTEELRRVLNEELGPDELTELESTFRNARRARRRSTACTIPSSATSPGHFRS